MKVKCLCSINSGKYDVGEVIDLPENEAKDLIKSGAARLTIASDLVQKAKEVIKMASPTKDKSTNQGEVKPNVIPKKAKTKIPARNKR